VIVLALKSRQKGNDARLAEKLGAHFVVMLLVLVIGTFRISSVIDGSFAAAIREWCSYYLCTWEVVPSLFGGAALGSALLTVLLESVLERLCRR